MKNAAIKLLLNSLVRYSIAMPSSAGILLYDLQESRFGAQRIIWLSFLIVYAMNH